MCIFPVRQFPPLTLAVTVWLAALLAAAERGLAVAPPSNPPRYETFAEWKTACDRLPPNRALGGALPPRSVLPLKASEFDDIVTAYMGKVRQGTLAQTNLWIGEIPGAGDFFNLNKAYFRKTIPFQPFVQKLVVPAGSRVFFHGDLHGDVRSLLRWFEALHQAGELNDFTLAKPDSHLVMLGDYTDRGFYGIEVIYTLFRLALANPDRVFLVRGNHEDLSLAANYGFLAEGQAKYGREFNPAGILRAYDFMPVAIYLGSGGDFIQCNHGGMEPGFDPTALLAAAGTQRFQLLGSLRQARFAKENPAWLDQLDPTSRRVAESQLSDFAPASPVSPATLGFMWNDFTLQPLAPQLRYDSGRALVFGDRATAFILNKASNGTNRVHAVFRAHQHSGVLNPMMRRLKVSNGVFRHWQAADIAHFENADETQLASILERSPERPIPPGSVWTFNVAPDTVYGEGCKFDFDTYGLLRITGKFADWRLRVVNVPAGK